MSKLALDNQCELLHMMAESDSMHKLGKRSISLVEVDLDIEVQNVKDPFLSRRVQCY
jgi:catabolite regulation protein CreA